MDPGAKSEGEEEMGASASGSGQHGIITTINVHNPNSSLKHHHVVTKAGTLGRTPNHLTLSTTSTLSVGSTGSQARLIQSSHAPSMYQPVMMKDLGKDQESPRSSDSETPASKPPAAVVSSGNEKEDTGGYAAIDRHLNAFNMADNANIVDYMQNLKVKHLEIQLSEEKQDTENDKDSVDVGGGGVSEGEGSTLASVKGEEEKKLTVVAADKPKTSVTKSQKERHNETQKSEKLILNIDTSKMDTSTSPIKIIKIKSRSRSVSPRRPLTVDGTSKLPRGKELTADEVVPVPLAHGILKRSSSAKSMETPDLLATPTGILKRSLSPKDLAKLDGLSPRNSFDSRASPVRSPQSDYCHSPCYQPNTVIDNRSPVVVVKHKGRSATKSTSRTRSVSASASVCNSLDSEASSMMGPSAKKKRSLSTSTFDQNQMSSMDSEMSLLSPSYYYNRSCFSSAASLTSNGGNNSFDNDLSQERIMYDGPIVIHSHDYRRKRSHSPGNEAILSKAIEQPTCMECFLQSRKVS